MDSFSRKIVGTWLLIGCVMVFFQVILGGVTRLTESGLSITEWKPIKGTLPPLNQQEWNQEFEHYKEKAQYKIKNEGMSLDEFKWIFFWEYFHRFWARFIGVVFAIGFGYFIYKGWLNKDLLLKISPLFLWGAVEGLFGWIMVSKGLTGIFVPPFFLSLHLFIALLLLGYLVWLTLYVYRGRQTFTAQQNLLRKLSICILVVLYLQLFLGGLLSGMKAGLFYPTWPDMNGQFVPSALYTESASSTAFFTYNSQDTWARALVQFLHRMTAYTLVVLVILFFIKSRNITTDKIFKTGLNLFPVFVLLQALIGILTVLHCVGHIPVSWGVLHQAGAMFLIAETVFVIFHLSNQHTQA